MPARGDAGPVTTDLDDRLDRAPCGYLAFGDDGRITAINQTLADLLGYDRDELIGRHVETTMGVGTRIFFQTHLFPLIAMHGAAQEIFLLLRTRNGGELATLLNAVRRERDGVSVAECIVMQVRERQKYEAELLAARRSAELALASLAERQRELQDANHELEAQQERLQEQAEELERARAAADQANAAKSTFLAMMSHELRTPLNAIGGYVQLIELGIHGPVTEAQREALGRITRSQRHLLRLINDILDLAKIEAGRVDYRIEPVPLASIVSTAVQFVQPQMAEKRLQCELTVPPDAAAHADREKLEQVVLNLLTNAVKFTPSGGRISVDVAHREAVPGMIFLRVSDTGIGIAESKIRALFEPFVQVQEAQTGSAEGTGLGLAISRNLARGMQGDLRVRSEPGAGSTFTVALRDASG